MPMTRVVPHTTAPHQTCGCTCWHRLALLRLLSPRRQPVHARAVARGFVGRRARGQRAGRAHRLGSIGRSPTGSGGLRESGETYSDVILRIAAGVG